MAHRVVNTQARGLPAAPRRLRTPIALIASALSTVILAIAACDLGPRKPAPPPTSRPATRPATQPGSAPASAPATQPASSPSSQATAGAEASLESPPVPEFVRVESKADVGRKSSVVAKVEAEGRLTIETDNVTGLQIRRELLDLPRNRSTLLYLDGQVFEWTPASKVTEFRRSPAGVWTPVRGP